MKWIGEMTARVFDLIEAEGRSLRANVVRTAVVLAAIWLVAVAVCAGVGLLAAGMFIGLMHAVGAAGAAAITGGALLLVALIGGLLTPWLMR